MLRKTKPVSDPEEDLRKAFRVFDLDGELDFKTKKVLTLHCLVPSNFREVTDEFGEPKLPYYNLTPFNIKQIDADNYAF